MRRHLPIKATGFFHRIRLLTAVSILADCTADKSLYRSGFASIQRLQSWIHEFGEIGLTFGGVRKPFSHLTYFFLVAVPFSTLSIVTLSIGCIRFYIFIYFIDAEDEKNMSYYLLIIQKSDSFYFWK